MDSHQTPLSTDTHVQASFEPPQQIAYGPEEIDQFITELRRSKEEVEMARKQFDTVTDPLLVDHVVFRLGAAEKRFNYLFQMAKKLGVSTEGMNWLWYEE